LVLLCFLYCLTLNFYKLTFKPNYTFLFSYAWLAIEIYLFLYLIQSYTTDYFLISLLFFLAFARLYWWLNFSPDSAIQTLFILGVIPIQFCANYFFSPDFFWVICGPYVLMLLVIGFYRIYFTSYHLSKEAITISLFKNTTFKIDQSRQITFIQNSRGRVLNFGCLLIPVERDQNKDKGIVHFIFLGQRSICKFRDFIRVDGIKNVKKVLNMINQNLYE